VATGDLEPWQWYARVSLNAVVALVITGVWMIFYRRARQNWLTVVVCVVIATALIQTFVSTRYSAVIGSVVGYLASRTLAQLGLFGDARSPTEKPYYERDFLDKFIYRLQQPRMRYARPLASLKVCAQCGSKNLSSARHCASCGTLFLDNEVSIGEAAEQLLDSFEASHTTESYVDALNSQPDSVRHKVAEILGSREDQYCSDILTGLLCDGEVEVRLAAIKSLGQRNSAKAGGPLVAMLLDKSYQVRRAAAATLRLGTDQRIAAFLDELESRGRPRGGYTTQDRLDILRVLGQIGDGRTVLAIVDVLKTDPQLRDSALAALEQIGTPEACAALEDHRGNTSSV